MQHKKHKNKGHTKHAEAISSKHKITKQHTNLEKALEIKQKAEYVICMQNNDILSHSRTESNI